jgi:hypothetical protein
MATAWHWAHPAYLALLPACLLPAGWFWWQDRHRRGLAFTQVNLVTELLSHPRQYVRYSRAFLQSLACAGLLLALARPQAPLISALGAQSPEVLVVLDVSRSMRADDVVPTRLGAAKRLIAGLAARHPASRFGLVVFAGASQMRVPLTDDLDMFAGAVADTEITESPGEGTAIGDALALGLERLTADRQAVSKSGSGPGSWLVLFTDGANHLGRDPEEVAGNLERFRVGLGVVGMGSEHPTLRREWDEVAQARRPLQDVFGRAQTWEPLDLGSLQRLAARSQQGFFTRGDNPQGAAALDPIWGQVNFSSGKRPFSWPVQEWFWLPLALALSALAADFVLARIWFRRLLEA